MAIIRLDNKTICTDKKVIAQQLSALNVVIGELSLQQYLGQAEMSRSLEKLLELDILNLAQRQEILQSLRPQAKAKEHFGLSMHYDLLVANLTSSSLYELLAHGSRPHQHAAEQVLYLLKGECIIGFSHPDGYLLELMLTAPEYIKVPAGVRHWFSLSALLDLKAVRYFTQANKFSTQRRPNEFDYSYQSSE